jgi:hypothetical protein
MEEEKKNVASPIGQSSLFLKSYISNNAIQIFLHATFIEYTPSKNLHGYKYYFCQKNTKTVKIQSYRKKERQRERELKYEIRELDFPEGSTPFNCVSLNAVSIGKEKKLIGSLKERKEKKKNIIEGVRSMTNCFQLK